MLFIVLVVLLNLQAMEIGDHVVLFDSKGKPCGMRSFQKAEQDSLPRRFHAYDNTHTNPLYYHSKSEFDDTMPQIYRSSHWSAFAHFAATHGFPFQ